MHICWLTDIYFLFINYGLYCFSKANGILGISSIFPCCSGDLCSPVLSCSQGVPGNVMLVQGIPVQVQVMLCFQKPEKRRGTYPKDLVSLF